jgi:lysine 2,3-aminomutase
VLLANPVPTPIRTRPADPKDLTELMRELLRKGVKPYYLHHCDLAEGISNFRTTFEQGQELMRAIRGHVSGLAQPEYVLHIPDGSGKVPIGPSYLEQRGSDWIVTDYLGRKRVYPGADSGALSSQTGAGL